MTLINFTVHVIHLNSCFHNNKLKAFLTNAFLFSADKSLKANTQFLSMAII